MGCTFVCRHCYFTMLEEALSLGDRESNLIQPVNEGCSYYDFSFCIARNFSID